MEVIANQHINMLDKKVTDGRLKPKKESMFKKTKRILKVKAKVSMRDLAYLDWFKKQEFGCYVCNNKHTESHHVKRDSTDKKDHTRLLPLCREHHHGQELSPHGTAKQWREIYPMETQHEEAKAIYTKYLKSIL